MTTSGTYTFNPTIADFVDEAFARCGMDPRELHQEHLIQARMSMDLMLADWANDGWHQWTLALVTTTLTTADVDVFTATGTLEVYSMVLRRNNVDTRMTRISREEYLEIPTKTQSGRPDRYFVDRRDTTPLIYLWPAPENSTDQIVYWRLRRMQDTGDATNTVHTPYLFLEAVAAGLAARLSVKYAIDRYNILKAEAAGAYSRARTEDRDRGPTIVRPVFRRRR